MKIYSQATIERCFNDQTIDIDFVKIETNLFINNINHTLWLIFPINLDLQKLIVSFQKQTAIKTNTFNIIINGSYANTNFVWNLGHIYSIKSYQDYSELKTMIVKEIKKIVPKIQFIFKTKNNLNYINNLKFDI